MSKENKDIAAFPGKEYSGMTNPGMTLRDYFAAKAMQSFIRTAENGTNFGVSHEAVNLTYATVAYSMADAMLEARNAAK